MIKAARRIARASTKYQEALFNLGDISKIGSYAHSNLGKFGEIEEIGTAYLLSTRNEYFAYEL